MKSEEKIRKEFQERYTGHTDEEDEFINQFKNKKLTKNSIATQKATTKNKWLYTKDNFGKLEKGVASDE